MRTTIITLMLVIATTVAFAQKNVYIYKSDASNIAASSILEGKKVAIEVKDIRIIDGKTKIKSTFGELQSSILETLKTACPKAEYVSTADANVTINIDVDRYDVRVTGVVWTGITRYNIRVKNNGKSLDDTIEGLCTRGNVLGKGTAKKVIQMSFDDANKKLLKYFSENIN